MGLATFVYSRGALLTIYMKGFVFQDDPERSVLHRPKDPVKEAVGARSSSLCNKYSLLSTYRGGRVL